jgi:hypothetical protein
MTNARIRNGSPWYLPEPVKTAMTIVAAIETEALIGALLVNVLNSHATPNRQIVPPAHKATAAASSVTWYSISNIS